MDSDRKLRAASAMDRIKGGYGSVSPAPLSMLSQAAFLHDLNETQILTTENLVPGPPPAGFFLYPKCQLLNTPRLQMPLHDSYRLQPDQYMVQALPQSVLANCYWNSNNEGKLQLPLTTPIVWNRCSPDYYVAAHQPVPGPLIVASGDLLGPLPSQLNLLQLLNPQNSGPIQAIRTPLETATELSTSCAGREGDIMKPDRKVDNLNNPGPDSGQPYSDQTFPKVPVERQAASWTSSNGCSEASLEHMPLTGSPPQQERPGNPHDSTLTRNDSPDTRLADTAHNQQNAASFSGHDQDRHSNKECPGHQQGKPAKTTASSGKRPRDPNKPKRPLSAYNIFFKEERENLIKEMESNAVANEDQSSISMPSSERVQDVSRENTSRTTIKQRKKRPHRKITFQAMATIIASRWKNIDPQRLKDYDERAATDKQRYLTARQGYLQQQLDDKRTKLEMTVSEETRRKYLAAERP